MLAGAREVFQRHLHEDDDVLPLHLRFLDELGLGGFEHVDGDVRHRAEAAPFDEDALLVKDFRGLHHLALRGEHGGAGQARAGRAPGS